MTTTMCARPESPTSSAAENLPDATGGTMPIPTSRPASPCPDRVSRDAHCSSVGATPCVDQAPNGTQSPGVGASSCDRQTTSDAHKASAVAQLNGSQAPLETHTRSAAVELFFCAAFLDDVEKLRIATGNRLAAMEREGLNPDLYGHQLYALQQLEHQAILALQRAVRAHPLGPWIKRTVGVGEKQGARLIAAIGDVAYNHNEDRPRRGPAELWAYCGLRPGQRPRKGVQSNWNAEAKMRAFLIAESCMKHRSSPYRAVYDEARANWAERDTSDGHKHKHALRLVAKRMLRDLFVEARKVGA